MIYKKHLVLFLFAMALSAFFNNAEGQGVEYIENDIRISPRHNIVEKDDPRTLHFVVHHPDTRLIRVYHQGNVVPYDVFIFSGLQADEEDLHLPYTSKIEISSDYIEELECGKHIFNFAFEDGTIREFELEVVKDEKKDDYDLTIISFNVEHGTSVFININDKNILVDTGPNDMTKKRVVPFLKSIGIERIDYVLLTHWHWDHVSGLASIDRDLDEDEFSRAALDWFDVDNSSEGFEVGEVWYNLTDGETTGFDEIAGQEESGREHTEVFHVGNEFEIAGGRFTVLNAARFDSEEYPEYHTDNFDDYDNKNNRSLSFRLEYNGFVYCHGGDVYQHGQQAVLNTFGEEAVQAHLYHGNHHFHGGLSTEYLKKVNPFLFITPAQEATYNREAYVDGVMGEVVPCLEENSNRFIENLFDFEVGHVVVQINNSEDWKYKTHYASEAEAAKTVEDD